MSRRTGPAGCAFQLAFRCSGLVIDHSYHTVFEEAEIFGAEIRPSYQTMGQGAKSPVPVRQQQELRFPGLFKLCQTILPQTLHCFQVREPTLGILYLVSSNSEIGNELAQVKHSYRPHSNLSSGLFEVGFRCAHLGDIGFVSEMDRGSNWSRGTEWAVRN